MRLLLLFLAVPLIEIALFIQIGGAIGLWATLAIVVVTAVLGAFLVRVQGIAAIAGLRSSLSELSDPTEPLAHGAMILVAGALLLTPGFFTDTVGFLLLIPAVRRAAFDFLRRRVRIARFEMGSRPGTAPRPGDRVIDGEYTEAGADASEPSARRGDSGWTRH